MTLKKGKFYRSPYVWIGSGILLCLLLIGAGITFTKREALLQAAVEKVESRLKEKHDLLFTYKKVGFSGLKTVTFSELTITPIGLDTLLTLGHAEVSVRFWPLLSGQVKLGRVHAEDLNIRLIKKDSVRNYGFLFGKQDSTQVIDPAKETHFPNLASLTNQMLNNIFFKIPRHLDLKKVSIEMRSDSLVQKIDIPQTFMRNGRLKTQILSSDQQENWHIAGKINGDQRVFDLQIYPEQSGAILPLLAQKWGLKLGFDTLHLALHDVFWKNNEFLHLKATSKVNNLNVFHRRISSSEVRLPEGQAEVEWIVGPKTVALGESSAIKVKKLIVHPQAEVRLYPYKTYALQINTPWLNGQEVFDSFPSGLFETLEGIRVSGDIKYHMSVFLDDRQPDSVQFSSQMEEKNFKVNAWGKADIPALNRSFEHTPFEDDIAVRSFVVGPENPQFTPLQDISSHLRHALLTTEDPSFFYHKGFVEEAIRSSIAINYKEKGFKRGGSTISMQLVKNVYLNRNKTIMRKLEEALLVWLLEGSKTVTKERMFEVYLNIIEWGRNIYGIREASRYYFGKHPSDLNVGESIFLASIVPRPKTGLYSFTYTGGLKPYIYNYFQYIGDIMARRGHIPADSTSAYGFYGVSLQAHLRPARPVGLDTLTLDPPPQDFLMESIKNRLQIQLPNINLPIQPQQQ
jgi:hypothetical protein